MSAFDFSPEDVQLIGALLAGQVRVVQQADGSLGLVEGTGSQQDIIDGHLALSMFSQHPAAQADDPAKWQALADQATASLDAMWERQAAAEQRAWGYSPTLDKTFLQMERALQSGDAGVREMLLEHVAQYGAPTPTRRQLAVLGPEEQQQRIQNWKAQAEARGLTFQQHIQALDQAGTKAALTEVAPSMLAEEQAAKDLAALGRKKIDGRSYTESLGAYVRHEAEGKGAGSRQMPFDPRLTPEQKRDAFLKTVPRETLAKWMRENPGQDPRAFADQTFNAARVATVHAELQGRMARRDVKLPPMPRPVFNESTDRKGDIARAMLAHGVTDPEQFVEKRRRTVANTMDLDVRAAYAEEEQKKSGQPFRESVEDFKREHFIPKSVRDEYQEIDPGLDDEEPSGGGDDRRSDIASAWQQHSGG